MPLHILHAVARTTTIKDVLRSIVELGTVQRCSGICSLWDSRSIDTFCRIFHRCKIFDLCDGENFCPLFHDFYGQVDLPKEERWVPLGRWKIINFPLSGVKMKINGRLKKTNSLCFKKRRFKRKVFPNDLLISHRHYKDDWHITRLSSFDSKKTECRSPSFFAKFREVLFLFWIVQSALSHFCLETKVPLLLLCLILVLLPVYLPFFWLA